jgi:hypothetical protein
MRNMGSTFIFLAFNVILLMFLLIHSIFSCKILSLRFREKLIWNYFLRFMLQQYTTLYISALINLNRIDYSNLPNNIGTYLSFVTIGICVLFPGIIAYLIHLRSQMAEIDYETKYGTITEGLKKEGLAKYWQVFLIIKQMITLTILVQAR